MSTIKHFNCNNLWNCLSYQIIELILCYVDINDLKNCSLVCKKWFKILKDENSEVWRLHCCRKLPKSILKSDLLSNLKSYKAKLRAWFYAWDPYNCSINIYIKPSGFILHRNPGNKFFQSLLKFKICIKFFFSFF